MTMQEYFKDWLKVIDKQSLDKIIPVLNHLYKITDVTPKYENIFKAFTLCSLKDLKIVFLGMDPYPQKGVATGVLFGNSPDTKDLSPSLEVIKEACIDYSVPHPPIEFDITLESWANQGILMINSALTVEVGKTGSHTMLWRPFIAKLLTNLSDFDTGIVYVLFGNQAQTFEPYINKQFNDIIKIQHPSYFARVNQNMPHKLFVDIDTLIKGKYGEPIKWYNQLT